MDARASADELRARRDAAEQALSRTQAIGRIGDWQVDFRTGVIYASAEARRIVGLAPDEPVTPQAVIAALPTSEHLRLLATWRRLQAGAARNGEFRLRGDGTAWCEVRTKVERTADGAVVGACGIVQDITARKASERENETYRQELWSLLAERSGQLERSRHDLQAVLDAVPSMIGYWDRELRNRFANHAYRDWFGIDPATIPGKHIRDVIGAERYALNLPYIEAALRGEAQEFERAIPAPDGSQVRHSLARYIPDIADGAVRGFYVEVTDITARKRDEAERIAALERQRNALVREVHHRIKNHLQGVVGLLNERARRLPQLAPLLERTVDDVQTIALAYGLQSTRDDAEAPLGPLLELAVKITAAHGHVHCVITDDAAQRLIPQASVVPLALTVNELLANAIKHRAGADACGIAVRADIAAGKVRVAVSNAPASLPPGFDYAAGRGLGTGLELVRILLPRNGARLDFRQESDTVTATLELLLPAS